MDLNKMNKKTERAINDLNSYIEKVFEQMK